LGVELVEFGLELLPAPSQGLEAIFNRSTLARPGRPPVLTLLSIIWELVATIADA